MSAEAFLADLEAKPEALRSLASSLDAQDPWRAWMPTDPRRIVFLGMGSSRFAANVAAGRLRARGLDAVSEYASADAAHPGGPGTLAVAVSASGDTDETVAAAARHREAGSTVVALSNEVSSPITSVATGTVPLLAGPEEGGVACRTFQHTVALLLALEATVIGGSHLDVVEVIRAAARATEELLRGRERWVPAAAELLTSTGQTFLAAPHERLGSADQGALMFREGPRLAADACETGDWLHVDVYLTKPLDYRLLLFPGSRFDPSLMAWIRERGSTVVTVGPPVDGASATVRYEGDERPDVALLTEVLVPELIAAEVWRRQARAG